jgi:hypothetical protein
VNPTDDNDEMTAAERALALQLQVVRDHPPAAGADLAARVLRTARWQRALRAPLLVGAMLANAVGEGLRVLLGAQTEPRR